MNATTQEQTTSLRSPHKLITELTGHSRPYHPRNNMHQQMLSRNKDFECPVCKQRFTRKHNMVSHQAIHNGDKFHRCTHCGMSFRRIHDLKRHLTLHTGERPFRCEWCHRAFARPDALIRHHKSPHACPGTKIKDSAANNNSSLQLPLPGNVRFDMRSGPWRTNFEPGLVTNRRGPQPMAARLHPHETQYLGYTYDTSRTFKTGEDARRASYGDLYSRTPINSSSYTTNQVQTPTYRTGDMLPSPADSQFEFCNNNNNDHHDNGSLSRDIVHQNMRMPIHPPRFLNESPQVIGAGYRTTHSKSGFLPTQNMELRTESNIGKLPIISQDVGLNQKEVARQSKTRALPTCLKGPIALLKIERMLPHPSHLRTRLIAQESIVGIRSDLLHLRHALSGNSIVCSDSRSTSIQGVGEYPSLGIDPASLPSNIQRTNGNAMETPNCSPPREWPRNNPLFTAGTRSDEHGMTQRCLQTLVETTRRTGLCFDNVNRDVSIENALDHKKNVCGTPPGKKLDHVSQGMSKIEGKPPSKNLDHAPKDMSEIGNDFHAQKYTLPHGASYSRQNPTISLMCNTELKTHDAAI